MQITTEGTERGHYCGCVYIPYLQEGFHGAYVSYVSCCMFQGAEQWAPGPWPTQQSMGIEINDLSDFLPFRLSATSTAKQS